MPFIALDKISIPEDRQREDIGDISGLAVSIQRRKANGQSGLINPVILDENFVLRAGFRRFSAHKFLEEAKIEFRFEKDLSATEHEILELEENVHRKQLDWEEEAKAIQRIHKLYSTESSEWTSKRTAEMLGLSQSAVSRAITVVSAAEADPTILSRAQSVSSAYNKIQRRTERKIAAQLEEVTEIYTTPDDVEAVAVPTSKQLDLQSIHNVSFLDWAPTYSGPKFNLLHCDLPYGIDFQDSDQAGSESRWESYADSADVYWELLQCLATHWDKLMAKSSHLVFWYSLKHQDKGTDLTRKFFAEHLPQVKLNPFPLIWHKSDNKGILPDAQRGPRQIYETALFGSTDDRKIVEAVGNCYSGPTNKTRAIHQSEKSQAMLEFFFRMVVDDTTRLLDPTCGGGSALRAAERRGARAVVGLELNPDFAEAAQLELTRQRKLESLA